jgi:hypothetical protein
MHRDEAELSRRLRVPAAGDQHGAEAVGGRVARAPLDERLQGVAGAARAVGGDRPLVGHRRGLRVTHRAGVARRARIDEQRAVRRLRRMREPAREGVDDDRGAAGRNRRSVAPQSKREPETEVRGADGVRPLARHERRRRRHPDDERVERLRQLDRLVHRAAQQRFGVRDRRRPGVDDRRGLLAREPFEEALADARRRELEQPPDARAKHAVDRGLVVRVARERPRDARRVQRERHAEQR